MKWLTTLFSRQFLFFLFFGGISAVISIAIGWLLYRDGNTDLPYPIAVSVGAFVAILVNFNLNYAFNFTFRGRSMWDQFKTFFAVAVVGIVLTSFFAWLFDFCFRYLGIEIIKLDNIYVTRMFLAHILAVIFVAFYSFVAHKLFSFNDGFINWCKIKIKNN